jgi:hypothetical protein
MIRYSSYGATNFRPPGVQTYLDPLKMEYRELVELRERVRNAEAAAQRTAKGRDRVDRALATADQLNA